MATLVNSRGASVVIDPIEIVDRVNREGCDCNLFLKELFPNDPKDGEWVEAIGVPTSNGIYNPETGEDEFCRPFWDGALEDCTVKRMFYMEKDKQWVFACHAKPHWESFFYERKLFPEDPEWEPIDEIYDHYKMDWSRYKYSNKLDGILIAKDSTGKVIGKDVDVEKVYKEVMVEVPGNGTIIYHFR